MSQDERSQKADGRPDSLAAAVRMVKMRSADRTDVVVDMKEADRARLELLAQALLPVINDISDDDERFDFAVSSGLQPRLWIDATSHVVMGRDRRLYRFVRDTRLGRVVLRESHDIGEVADAITTYVAERIVEREQAFAGDDIVYRRTAADTAATADTGEGGEARTYQALSDARRAVTGQAEDVSPTADEPEPARPSEPEAAHETQAEPPSEPATKGSVFWNVVGWIVVGLVLGGGGLFLMLENGVF